MRTIYTQQEVAQTASLCGVYVTPSHQFPYGSILSAAKRTQLLQWAIDRKAWIIEDDYDSEFIYSGQPLPALQGMYPGERVLYMGTFSKALAPALRLSYLILPQPLLAQYKQLFPHLDNTVSRLTQIPWPGSCRRGIWNGISGASRLRRTDREPGRRRVRRLAKAWGAKLGSSANVSDSPNCFFQSR